LMTDAPENSAEVLPLFSVPFVNSVLNDLPRVRTERL